MDVDEVQRILRQQSGLISRAQAMVAGAAPHDVARLVRRREWASALPGVYANHTGPLSWVERAWAGVLTVWPAALCDISALRAAEGPGSSRKREEVIHVCVDRHRRLVAPEGVVVHRLARLDERVRWNLGPPRLAYEDAALDVAIAAPSDFDTISVLASACQSRRTTASRMLETLDDRARVPRRRWVGAVLEDVAQGTCSVLEHGYLNRVEQAHGLPAGQRQLRSITSTGIVYRDVAYRGLLVELDGRLFHDTAEQRDRDFERDLDAAVEGKDGVRLSYGQVFGRPCSTAGKVSTLLRSRGWKGQPTACGPDCAQRG